MGVLKEFKEFAMKGNVVDLAVGVIIGAAFGGIVTSLVNDIIMPAIGIITGGNDFSGLQFKVGSAAIMYGKFIQTVFNFIIVAFCIFMVVKAMNRMKKKKDETPVEPEPTLPTKEEILLAEIRDLLKNK